MNTESTGVVSRSPLGGPASPQDFWARLLIENLPDQAVLMLDSQGYILSYNPAGDRLYGASGGSLVGRHFSTLFTPGEARTGRHDDVLERAKANGSVQAEDWQRRLDGKDFWAESVLLALRPNDTAPVGFAWIVRDLTARKRADEVMRQLHLSLEARIGERTRELATATTELEAFTYSIAHDLRAPLRGISGFLEAMRDDFGAQIPAEALAFLERAIASGDRMRSMIDDLLKLSRASRHALTPIATSTRPLVDEAVGELAESTGGRNISWQIGDLPTVVCDPVLLRQVFVNVIGNAVKFTQRQPAAVIAVRSEDRNGETTFVVSDNGVGFDVAQARKLFTPFFRMHVEPQFAGSGVGLATAERIVRRHGGRIWAEAQKGKGATFYFTVGRPLQEPVG